MSEERKKARFTFDKCWSLSVTNVPSTALDFTL